MKWLKSYSKYQESIVIDIKFQSIDLSESLNIDWHDVLLKSISAEETDLFSELGMDKNDYKDNSKLDLDYLCGDGDRNQPYSKFINSLSKEGLRISEVQNSNDLSTFINKIHTIYKILFIYYFKFCTSLLMNGHLLNYIKLGVMLMISIRNYLLKQLKLMMMKLTISIQLVMAMIGY